MFLNEAILNFITMPIGKLYFLSPVEAFFVRIKVAFVFSVLVSFPFVIYQIWLFVKPALYEHERRYVAIGTLLSVVLFYLGVGIAIFVAVPYGVKFLLQFGSDNLQALIRADEYMNFLILTSLGFGILFQIPLALTLLALLGIVNPYALSKYRKHAILAILVLSAIITPSVDALGMLMLSLPVILLFEFALQLSKLFYRRKHA